MLAASRSLTSKGHKAMSDPFDKLNVVAVDKPFRVMLLGADDLPWKDKNGQQAWIEIYSSDSDVARKFRNELRTQRLRMRNPNQLTGEDRELLAALTSAWYLPEPNGDPLDIPCTRDNAFMLYNDNRRTFIYYQVDMAASDRKNFVAASSTS
jgi:hypothetical protein